jgi:cardiolipin synthase A/B
MNQILISLLALAVLAFAVATAAHALLYKRDTRAVIAWVGFIALVPLAGAVLYWVLGVNRVRRRARLLRRQLSAEHAEVPRSEVRVPEAYAPLVRLADQVAPFPLCAGNSVEPLENGDEAFPPMLAAINDAERSIVLATYIFDNDEVGREFADALTAACRRGVEVRVLIDAVGQYYSFRSMIGRLRAAGVTAAAFMPVLVPRNPAAINLRNHRKLLIADGVDAFTGGMNIRAGNVLAKPARHPVRDLQFRVRGPVVSQLMGVFAHDWSFATGEHLGEDPWFPEQAEAGPVAARTIPDGPDEHFEIQKMLLLGALAQATRSVAIATPYFLPDAALISALNTAALRGVEVHILLPQTNNLKFVQWASFALYWQVLERGCRIWHTPGEFDHSKLMLVDDHWVLVGSTNWDPRSLRLNYELNLECYDTDLSGRMRAWFDRRRAAAHEVTKEEMDSRRLGQRLRDGAARLLAPYL